MGRPARRADGGDWNLRTRIAIRFETASMKRRTAACLGGIALGVVACASKVPPRPAGAWEWVNADLEASVAAGATARPQADHEFVVASNTCRIEALKVPIPSPACWQPPRQDCTGKVGFDLGFCQGYRPPPRCDYSAVNEARRAQDEIFRSCMSLRGWSPVWVPSGTPPHAPGGYRL